MSSPITESDDHGTDGSDEIQQSAAPPAKPPEALKSGSGDGKGTDRSCTTKPKVVVLMKADPPVKRYCISANGILTSPPPVIERKLIIEKKKPKNPWKTISLRCPVPMCAKSIRNVTRDVNQTRKSLNRHIKKRHKIVSYPVCLACNDKYWNLRRHVKRYHPCVTDPLHCRVCPNSKAYLSYQDLKEHHYLMHVEGSFGCLHCPFKGFRRIEMHRHNDRVHPAKPRLQCAFEGCEQTFKFANEQKNHHLRMHLKLQHVHCTWPGCDYRANLKRAAMEHVKHRHFQWPNGKKPKDDSGIELPDATRYVKVLGLSEALLQANEDAEAKEDAKVTRRQKSRGPSH